MDQELIRIGIEIGIALIVAGWGWVKRHRDMKELTRVIDESDAENEHFREVAVRIGADVAGNALKKWLK